MNETYTHLLRKYIHDWQDPNQGVRFVKNLSLRLRMERIFRYYKTRCIIHQMNQKLKKRDELEDEDNIKLQRAIVECLHIDWSSVPHGADAEFWHCTKQFISRAKSQFTNLSDESLYQALRNVWIMNLIQMISGHCIELTDAMYAYSMLYPLTDNIIDDPLILLFDKKEFVNRLGRRLAGELLTPKWQREEDAYCMVALIEKQYPRNRHESVYMSLQLIHEAQVNSLRQQQDLTVEKLIELSFHKGAASVIADGYLILGELTVQQIDFFIGYGIVLQLCDDLQDMKEDRAHGHRTIFSVAKCPQVRWHRIRMLMRLSNDLRDKLSSQYFCSEACVDSMLSATIPLLMGEAMYHHQELFPAKALRQIDRIHPIGVKRFETLKQKAKILVSYEEAMIRERMS